jgi:hypothetical protein
VTQNLDVALAGGLLTRPCASLYYINKRQINVLKEKRPYMNISIPMEFDGFWIEDAVDKLPAEAGIYTVFGGAYDPDDKSVKLEYTIYIGWADNVREAVKASRHWDDWRKECEDGWKLCFNFAPVAVPNNERGAAALIFEQKPPVNEEYKYKFPFDDTKVWLTGKTGLLDTTFEVYRFTGEDVEPDEPEDPGGFGDLQDAPHTPNWGHLPPPMPEEKDDDKKPPKK